MSETAITKTKTKTKKELEEELKHREMREKAHLREIKRLKKRLKEEEQQRRRRVIENDFDSNKDEKDQIEQKVSMYANHKGCQSPISKTDIAFKFILKMVLLKICSVPNGCEKIQYDNTKKKGVKHINIIVTSRNLAEIRQTLPRARIAMPQINILTLSSKARKDKNDECKNVGEVMARLSPNDPNDLPDLIIVCSHDKRFSDILKLLNHAKRQIYLMPEKDDCQVRFKYDVLFDEIDQKDNLNRFVKFHQNAKQGKLMSRISSFVFISGTMFNEFWINLKKKCGIEELHNIDTILPFPIDYKTQHLKWRTIQDHNHIKLDDSDDGCLAYVKQAMKFINTDEKQIIFAPGENKITTHIHIIEYVMSKFNKCCGFIHNGTFKGFIPDNIPDNIPECYLTIFKIKNKTIKGIAIDDFAALYKVGTEEERKNELLELRDILRKFNEIFPQYSLVISGFNTIRRGITFNTNGFNFTYAILSTYHAKHRNELIQLIGRLQGNKEYCKKMNIICTDNIYKVGCEYITGMKKLCEETKDMFTMDDCASIVSEQKTKKKKEKELPALCIRKMTYDEYDKLYDNKGKELKAFKRRYLKNDKTSGPRKLGTKYFNNVTSRWQANTGRNNWITLSSEDVLKPTNMNMLIRAGVANKNGGCGKIIPCYKTSEYKDDDIEFWYIIKESDMKPDMIEEFKNKYH